MVDCSRCSLLSGLLEVWAAAVAAAGILNNQAHTPQVLDTALERALVTSSMEDILTNRNRGRWKIIFLCFLPMLASRLVPRTLRLECLLIRIRARIARRTR